MNETELKKLEDRLWSAADKMRGAVSVSDYKFIVLGLILVGIAILIILRKKSNKK